MPPHLFNHAPPLFLIRNATLRPGALARARIPAIHRTSRKIASTPSLYKSRRKATASSSLGGGNTDKQSDSFRSHIRRYGPTVLAVIPIALFLLQGATILWVNGPSMTPYLNEDYAATHLVRDLVLVRGKTPGEKLERGMVVIFPSLSDPSRSTIKRIVALPGDRVSMRPKADGTQQEPDKSQIVPWNHVWVEGDNPRASLDSNNYGPISMNLISGQVLCVLSPRPRMLRWEDWEGDEYGEHQRTRVERDAVAVHAPPLY